MLLSLVFSSLGSRIEMRIEPYFVVDSTPLSLCGKGKHSDVQVHNTNSMDSTTPVTLDTKSSWDTARLSSTCSLTREAVRISTQKHRTQAGPLWHWRWWVLLHDLAHTAKICSLVTNQGGVELFVSSKPSTVHCLN